MSILFIDEVNFHARNFPQLFQSFKVNGIDYEHHKFGSAGLKLRFGRYHANHKNLSAWIEYLERIPCAKWGEAKLHGVNIFSVARYEVVNFKLKEPDWFLQKTNNSSDSILEALLSRDSEALLKNMAAACFWIDYWFNYFEKSTSKFKFLCVFGNSLIYTRSAVFLAERYGLSCLTFEHFFTGLHYFIEPRSACIQGASSMRLPVPQDVQPDVTLVENALFNMNNKNVRPQALTHSPQFLNEEKTILLLAQVCNDFSLIVDHNKTIGSVAIYLELIDLILEKTDCNLLVKTHPYEKSKVDEPVTYKWINGHIAKLDAKYRARIQLYEEYSIVALAEVSDAAVTLSSQSALELCRYDVPVSVLSDAFFSKHGFTYEFDSPSLFVDSVNQGTVFSFDNASKRNYYRFMTWVLSNCVGPSTSNDKVLEYFSFDGLLKTIPAAKGMVASKVKSSKVKPSIVKPKNVLKNFTPVRTVGKLLKRLRN